LLHAQRLCMAGRRSLAVRLALARTVLGAEEGCECTHNE
jgi:hypothetical protein